MTARLFTALYISLFISMFVLLFSDSPLGWVLFAFVFIAVFGGLFFADRPFVVAGAFLLVGVAVWGGGLWLGWQSKQIVRWTRTDGYITQARFCTVTINGNEDYSGLCLDYAYTVANSQYEGDSTDTKEFAGIPFFGIIPEQYREDHKVTIYYDPANPGDSRLAPGVSLREWLPLGVGAWLAALAVATLVSLIWDHYQRTAAAHLG
jgi:uncharacterized membrane protein